MRRPLGALMLLGAALVQVTWAPRAEIAGAFPNLVLLAVLTLTWIVGVRPALAWACIGGLMLDLTAAGPLGPHAVALLAGVYLTGFWTRNFDRSGPLQPVLAAAVSTALYSLILVELDDLLGLPVPPVGPAIQLTVAACIYNALLMPVALLVAGRLGGTVRSGQHTA